MKKRQITIGGVVGSGKTTIGKKLAEMLNYNFYSVGTFRRQIALEKFNTNINCLNTLEEIKFLLNNVNELSDEEIWQKIKDFENITKTDIPNVRKIQDYDTDILADNKQKELGIRSEEFIIEGRLAWKFCKDSFKVFLTCDPYIAATRIANDARKSEKEYSSIEELQEINLKRMESDKKRYLVKYGENYDCYNTSNFDIIINTTNLTPEQVVEKILTAFDEFYDQ